jgi:hypothetical protein
MASISKCAAMKKSALDKQKSTAEEVKNASTDVDSKRKEWSAVESDHSRSDIDGFRVDVSAALSNAVQKTQIGHSMNLFHLTDVKHFFSAFGKMEQVYAGISLMPPSSSHLIQKQASHPDALDGKVVVRQIFAGNLCIVSAINMVTRKLTTGVVVGR